MKRYGTLTAMESLDVETAYGKTVIMVIVAITVILSYESFIKERDGSDFKPKEDQTCEGTPIEVTYPYYGGMLQPHACAPQCEDKEQHYVLYTNGEATQCQKLPGCLDWGRRQKSAC